MTLDEIKDAIKDLSPSHFAHVLSWAENEETARRRNQTIADAAQLDLVKELQDQGKFESPKVVTEVTESTKLKDVPAWVNPGTDHSKMYHPGDIVKHGDKIVRSTHEGLNHWEPGTLAFDGRIWEIVEIPEPTNVPETPLEPSTPSTPTVPNWAVGVPYKKDQEVMYNSKKYKIAQDHTSADHWRPDAVASLYTPIG